MTEGKLLYDLRTRNHLTQKALSRKLGFTTSQYISNCERELCGLCIDAIKFIHKEFGKAEANQFIVAKVNKFEKQLRKQIK